MNLPNNILIFGGTGALGSVLVRRILDVYSSSQSLVVFSRDEAKHHKLQASLGDDAHRVFNHVGDVRDYKAVASCIRSHKPRLVINCAALKQVPLCEMFVGEAIKTNILGAENIANALNDYDTGIPLITISTDKACKPINSYGHTKALQEKITLSNVKYSCVVRYGNVLESTGSVIPFFKGLLKQGKGLPITDLDMTRFLLSLDDAVDLIFQALDQNFGDMLSYPGCILVPSLKAARIQHVAEVLCEAQGLDPAKKIYYSGIRPGEKLHEVLISEHEVPYTSLSSRKFHVIGARRNEGKGFNEAAFHSNHASVMLSKPQLARFLAAKGVIECKNASESQARQGSLAAIS